MSAVYSVLVPFSHWAATELGNGSRLWKKRLLPVMCSTRAGPCISTAST